MSNKTRKQTKNKLATAKITRQNAGKHIAKAMAFHQAGELGQAEKLYLEILVHEPQHAGVLHLLGLIRYRLNDTAGALALFDQAIALTPGKANLHYDRAVALRLLGRDLEDLSSYDRALACDHQNPKAHYNKGNLLESLNRYEEALVSYNCAIAIQPNLVEAHLNKAKLLNDLKRYLEAVASYGCALALQPSYETYCSQGAALENLHRHQDALSAYIAATKQKPEGFQAHLNEALCRLKMGDFAQGWATYEWRWRDERIPVRPFHQPLWLGEENLAGKTILLYAEQGLGDTLQSCRYVRLVSGLGAKVLLEVQPPLKALLLGLMGAEVFSENETLPDFDYHCPLMSLPLAFNTRIYNIPADIPYLFSTANKVRAWQERLGERIMPRIGLAWSGNRDHSNDSNRSLALASLVNILSASLQFVSLQPALRPEDAPTLEHFPQLQHFGDLLTDFSDTAALIEHMDLVISVDTSVAHLAGAMGKRVWLLLPFNPDWRWLLERDDSPWYPTMRLFRQPAFGDWDSVMAAVKTELASQF
jgi:hypothetical protein